MISESWSPMDFRDRRNAQLMHNKARELLVADLAIEKPGLSAGF